jgi:hypothetical protein
MDADTRRVLVQWYRDNPDDAREYSVEDIVYRFRQEGVTLDEAAQMIELIDLGFSPDDIEELTR